MRADGRRRILIRLIALAAVAGLGLYIALGYRDAGPTPLAGVPDLPALSADEQTAELARLQRLERRARPRQAEESGDPRLLEVARGLEALRRQGNPQAATRLGWYYVNGWGVERDRCTAVELFYEAARAGEAQAQFWLAMAYLPPNGRGVAPDKLAAFRWASAARAQGLPIAIELFRFFERNLAPDERAAAEASLAGWDPAAAPAPAVQRYPYIPVLVGLWPRQTHHVMPCRQPLAPYEDWPAAATNDDKGE